MIWLDPETVQDLRLNDRPKMSAEGMEAPYRKDEKDGQQVKSSTDTTKMDLW